MAQITILQKDQSYTIESDFELPYKADDTLAELIKSRLSVSISLWCQKLKSITVASEY